jgi:ankyrin repeat protein
VTDPDAIAFAHQMFDLARSGSDQLLGNVDSGVPVGLTDAAGNNLVMLAAYHGHAALVGGLAERGADVNAVNDRGQTPLAGAVFKGSSEVVQALVSAGADPDLGTPSARESAVFFGKDDLAALLSSSQARN